MREQPAAGECLAAERQPANAEQTFEALEREFHLPAQANASSTSAAGISAGKEVTNIR